MSRRPSEAPRFDVTGVKLAQHSLIRWLTVAAGVALCAALPLDGAFPHGNLSGISVLFATLLGLAAGALALAARAAPGTLLVEGNTLIIEKRRRQRIPLDRIALGLILPQRAAGPRAAGKDLFRYHVAMELKNGSLITIEAETMAEAQAILEAARLDPSQRRFSLRIGRAANKLVVGLFIAPLVFMGGTAALGFGLSALFSSFVDPAGLFIVAMSVTALVIMGLWRATMSAEVTIGSDGIVVRRGFRRRFIPYGRLSGITTQGSDIALQYRDGKVLPIPGDIDDPERRSALVERMREAMSAGAASHARVEALGRNGRPLAAWRDALRGLLDGDAGYRRIGLTHDDALGIVKDAGARAEHRIAAALALSSAKDPAVTERIRIAARACASERVRVALEQAGEGELEEEAIEEALREEQQVR